MLRDLAVGLSSVLCERAVVAAFGVPTRGKVRGAAAPPPPAGRTATSKCDLQNAEEGHSHANSTR